MQISRVGSLEKQSADNQPLFPGLKLLLHPPYRICKLVIFEVCLRSVTPLIVEIAIYSIYYYQTNSHGVVLGRPFQQKKKLVEDPSEKCDTEN